MSTHHDDSIEPLTEAAWARIEQQIFARLAEQRVAAPASSPQRARRVWLQWGLTAVAAVLLLAAGLRLRTELHTEMHTETQTAKTQRYTATTREQRIALPGVTVHLEPGSALETTLAGGATASCRLERGAAGFDVAPRRGLAPFVVMAAEVRVEVIGTVFRVVRVGSTAQVETRAGTVRVSARGQDTLVRAGERWPSAPSSAAAESASSAAIAAPVPAVDTRQTSSTGSSAARAPSTGSSAARAPGLAERQRARFEAAASAEATDHERALQGYEALSREQGPWASNALFALGRLELERRLFRAAERDLRSYLERYPRGPNVADARALLERMPPADQPQSSLP